MSIKPIHSDIKNHILGEIQEAKFFIYACVAWFNDPDIYDLLIAKATEGVIVELMIRDDSREYDPINFYADNSLDFSRLYKVGGKIYLLENNHNKYAVIDFKTILSGSYNWTIGAGHKEDGLESISISKNEYEAAANVAEEFIKLKKNCTVFNWSEKQPTTDPTELTIHFPIVKAVSLDGNIFKMYFADGSQVYLTLEQSNKNVLARVDNEIKVAPGNKIVKRNGIYWLESVLTDSITIDVDVIADDLPF